MTRNTILAVAVAAASTVALSACLGNANPVAPLTECELSAETLADVAGDTLTLEPGLRYIEREAGSDDVAQTNRVVDVCYVGRFTNGEAFDANVLAVPLGQERFIPGFERGLVGVGVGGIRRLIIAPELGYGSEPVRNQQTGEIVIPANSTLVFDVQVLRVR